MLILQIFAGSITAIAAMMAFYCAIRGFIEILKTDIKGGTK